MYVIKSKISVPVLPDNLVLRQSLLERMSLIPHRKLSVLCAPAGYGKTTLLAQWVNSKEGKTNVAWLSLSDRENNPERFWCYLLQALIPFSDGNLDGFINDGINPSDDDLDTLVYQITNNLPKNTILILDDFQNIDNEQIHQQLVYLLDYLPANLHLVVATRSRFPLPTVQLLIANQLLELTKEDLKFTQAEAASLFSTMFSADFSEDFVARLNSRAEGWVAGLRMIQLSAGSREVGDLEEIIRSFSGTDGHIFDYLADQVFIKQPKEYQQFLLCTSILEQMNADLCDHITESERGHEMLAKLVNDNLFISRTDRDGGWYRYHPLFKEFLTVKLREDPSCVPADLNQKAADWYLENGLIEKAIDHAFKADNYELVREMLNKYESHLWGCNDIATLRQWYAAFPDNVLVSHPELCLSKAWHAVSSGDLPGLVFYIEKIESYCRRNDSGDPQGEVKGFGGWRFSIRYFSTHLAILQAVDHLYRMQLTEALATVDSALKNIPASEGERERALALYFKGLILYWDTKQEDAFQAWREAAVVSQVCRHHAVHISTLCYLGQISTNRGHLSGAELFFHQALDYQSDLDGPVFIGDAHCHLGDLFLSRNQMDLAVESIKRGITLSDAGEGCVNRLNAYLFGARLEIALGNMATAQAYITKAYKLANRGGMSLYLEAIKMDQARLWIHQHRLLAAEHLLNQMDLTKTGTPALLMEQFLVTKARLFLAQNQYTAAQSLLESLLPAIERGNRAGCGIEILILLSLVFYRQGMEEQACHMLLKALNISRSEKHVRIFTQEGKTLHRLLTRLMDSGYVVDMDEEWSSYFTLLLRSFGRLSAVDSSPLFTSRTRPILIEPLSIRETQVLKLIAEGKTYEEIARDLVVALSTVQSHIRHIYQKLNAHSGTQAVSVARDLRLIST